MYSGECDSVLRSPHSQRSLGTVVMTAEVTWSRLGLVAQWLSYIRHVQYSGSGRLPGSTWLINVQLPSLRISTSYHSSSDIAWAYYRVTPRTGVLAQRGQLKYHFIRSKHVDAVFSFWKETRCLLLYYHKSNNSNTSYGWEKKVIIILHMSAVSNDWNKVWRKWW